jgi:hypothetical protein
MHKGKTIALLPLTPAEIMQYEKELTEKKKHGHDKDSRKSAIEQSSTINMKGGVLFAFKSVLADHDEPRYALTCTSPICSIDPTPSAMPLVGTNLLQKNEDEFLAGRPLGPPPLQRIGRQDERLLPEPPLLPSIGGDDLLQSRTTSIQEREDDENNTPSCTHQGEEEVQHGRPIHLPHGGGLVQLKFKPISDYRSSPR